MGAPEGLVFRELLLIYDFLYVKKEVFVAKLGFLSFEAKCHISELLSPL